MVTHDHRLKNTHADQEGTTQLSGAAPVDNWQMDMLQSVEERRQADHARSYSIVEHRPSKTEQAHSTVADNTHGIPASLGNLPHYEAFEADFRSHHQTDPARRRGPYEHYRLVYRYGYDLGVDPRYRSAEWSHVEQKARPRWEERNPGTWEQFKDTIRYAWNTARGARSLGA